jgi:hypothetical protein
MAKSFFTLQICAIQVPDMGNPESESERDMLKMRKIEDESGDCRINGVKNGRFPDFC